MEIEPPSILAEYDIILKPPPFPLHMVQYPLRDSNSPFESFLKLSSAKLKPKQHKLEFSYTPSRNFENSRKRANDDSKLTYTFGNEPKNSDNNPKMPPSSQPNIHYSSKNINNFTNYCVAMFDKKEEKIVFVPIESFLQMRRKFVSGESNVQVGGSVAVEKVGRGKQKEKNLEQKLRSYNYQKQILDNEKFMELEVFQRGAEECEEVVKNLREEKGKVKEVAIMGRNEYLGNLI